MYHIETIEQSGWARRCTLSDLALAADLARTLRDQGRKVRIVGLHPDPFAARVRRAVAQLINGGVS